MVIKIKPTIILAVIFGASVIFANEAKIVLLSGKLVDQNLKKSKINFSIESNVDIYGVQFDIKFNPREINLSENRFSSNVSNVKVYSKIIEEGMARVLMFSMTGDKVLDTGTANIVDILDIDFQPMNMFNGSTQVEFIDVVLVGKGGEEMSISNHVFDVDFYIPQKTSLTKTYPNPFNSTTTIDYQLSNFGRVTIIIYDLNGVEVKTLINDDQDANYYKVMWDGINEDGQRVPSGRYVLKMTAPEYSDTITMTLLK